MPYNQEEADEMDSLINQVSKVFFSWLLLLLYYSSA